MLLLMCLQTSAHSREVLCSEQKEAMLSDRSAAGQMYGAVPDAFWVMMLAKIENVNQEMKSSYAAILYQTFPNMVGANSDVRFKIF